ncbi:MAG: LysE family translocator [Phenylobacterium sp.]|uniref:LysE family translocator n=1 Tax=Phenylobacterium sp. TaxID=1871053 RepID=UPI00271E5E66|nr:LysE family translocator [Phenylobacterium sp.]MDO8902363.1 LysE family translocator [Phenylobacterium sp.]
MDEFRWASFLLAAVLIELTPGPNMGYLALVSARRGWGAGLLTVLGVTLGLGAHMLAAAAGLSQLAVAQPVLYQGLRWGGVLYLLWLAWDGWRGRGASAEIEDLSAGDWRDVRRGFLTNLLNPKALIFYVAVLPSFAPPQAQNPLQAFLLLGVMHLSVSVVIHTAIVALGARAYGWATRADRAPQVQAAFALGLVAVAGWVAWSTRGG